MIRIQAEIPYTEEIKTLRLTRNPFYYGIGFYTDTDGVEWDIPAMGNNGTVRYVCARKVDHNMPYYSTCSWGNSYGNHQWIPYYVEIIEVKEDSWFIKVLKGFIEYVTKLKVALAVRLLKNATS